MGFFDFLRRRRPADSGSGSGALDPTTAGAAGAATVAPVEEGTHHEGDATPDAQQADTGAGGYDSGGGFEGGGSDSSGGG